MIIGITRGVKTFMFILVVVITGFAASFFVLSQKDDETPLEQRTPALSLLSGFTLMLGDFEVDSYNETLNFEVAAILFVVFMLLVNVILLNLLIAIMGDIFGEGLRVALRRAAENTFLDLKRAALIPQYVKSSVANYFAVAKSITISNAVNVTSYAACYACRRQHSRERDCSLSARKGYDYPRI